MFQCLARAPWNLADSPSKEPKRGLKKTLLITKRPVNQKNNVVSDTKTAPPTDPTQPQMSTAKRRPANELTIRQSQNKEAGPEEEPVPSENNTDEDAPEASTAGQKSEKARKKRKEKRERDRDAQIHDLGDVADLHGCRLAWGYLCAAATELTELKYSVRPESERGKNLCQEIRKVRDKCLAAEANLEDEDHQTAPDNLAAIASLATSVWKYSAKISSLTGEEREREEVKMCRDLYGHVVPKMVQFLKKMLLSRQIDGALRLEAYAEIVPLLTASFNAAEMACKWDPRPELEIYVPGNMRHIQQNLSLIKERFGDHRKSIDDEYAEQKRLDRVAAKQKQEKEAFHALVWEKRQRILRNHRSRPSTAETMPSVDEREVAGEVEGEDLRFISLDQSPPSPISETEVLDCFAKLQNRDREALEEKTRQRRDAILNKSRRWATSSGVRGKTQQVVLDIDRLDTGVPSFRGTINDTASRRPRVNRAQTEEIPGPMEPEWTTGQTNALLKLLQRSTSPDRFDQIFSRHCGPFGQLGGFSLDHLKSQAKYLKEHMSGVTRQQPEQWEWLTSVSS